MKTNYQKFNLLLWLILPAGFVLLYPYLKSEPRYLKGLTTAILIYVLFFSVVIHEVSHGLAARFCGDTTAEKAGRLTLNPIQHVSVVGTIIVPLILHLLNASIVLGWAKPVPFNPVYLRHHPRDQVMLAMAGPLSNFTLSYLSFNLYLIIGFVFNHIFPASPVSFTADIFTPMTFFQQVPFEAFWFVLFEMLAIGVIINIVLAVFNLIPFPPLDGSWLLKAILPKKVTLFIGKIQAYGFLLLILALHFHLLDLFFYPLGVISFFLYEIASFCLG